ncbi:hypothetical protein KC953_00835 [Candidatus Saccharibacteria bacterium]|nr:hypothetical protein [Candidatus Saccharibacteria bacterium]
MNEVIPPNNGVRTREEREAVLARLKSEGGAWISMPPDYTTFSRDSVLMKLDKVNAAVLAETDADVNEVAEAHEKSVAFANSSFDFYEGKKDLGRSIERAFVVPMRSTRNDYDEMMQGNGYASESTPFVPLCDPVRFGVPSEIRMRTMYGLPPTVLDTYLKSSDDKETGALVLSPVYTDMIRDIRTDKESMAQRIRLMEVGAYILEKTAQFAHLQLGAKVIGLGATLPKITHFGQALRSMNGMENLTTTTGHGGTVYMIVETARKIMEETSIESHGRIGVIGGAGSIGWSSTVTALDMIPDHKLMSFDINKTRLYGKIDTEKVGDRVSVADSAAEVLRSTNIILTAITGRIDLDDEEYKDLDLTNKVIIDDSQPGCFDAAQVEARGGKLVWVVGEDNSDSKFITRDGYYTDGVPYNYGNNSGLYGHFSEFACGQEAAVIARSGEYDKAITAEVEPRNVRVISGLFRAAGVGVAPFQAFGRPVEIR